MVTAKPPAASSRGRRLVDFAPLRTSRPFARLWIGNSIAGVGAWVTNVAVGLQVYAMTESTFAVGLVGGIALGPMIVAGLWGGMIADVFDRRHVLIVATVVSWGATLALVALATADAMASRDGGDHIAVWPFYVATTVTAVATTIRHTTTSSVVARLLPGDMVSRATALGGISFGLSVTLGPAVAGVLASTVGLPWTFAADAVLFTAAFVGVLGLPALPPLGEQVREGLAFLRRATCGVRGSGTSGWARGALRAATRTASRLSPCAGRCRPCWRGCWGRESRSLCEESRYSVRWRYAGTPET